MVHTEKHIMTSRYDLYANNRKRAARRVWRYCAVSSSLWCKKPGERAQRKSSARAAHPGLIRQAVKSSDLPSQANLPTLRRYR